MAHWSLREPFASLAYNTADYAGTFSDSSAPTTTNVPSGKWGIWIDTDDNSTHFVINQGGTIKIVEATA